MKLRDSGGLRAEFRVSDDTSAFDLGPIEKSETIVLLCGDPQKLELHDGEPYLADERREPKVCKPLQAGYALKLLLEEVEVSGKWQSHPSGEMGLECILDVEAGTSCFLVLVEGAQLRRKW